MEFFGLIWIIFILFIFVDVIKAKSFLECSNSSPTLTEATPIARKVTNDNKVITLYRSVNAVTWCDSYHFCLHSNSHLSIATDVDSILTEASDDLIWVSGRRKDFGSIWTQMNSNLTDFDEDVPCISKAEMSGVDYMAALVGGGIPCTLSNTITRSEYFTCHPTYEVIHKEGTWYDAQNFCVSRGGRLPILSEIVSRDLPAHKYWIGILRRPWIWINSGNWTNSPIYNISFAFKKPLHPTEDCLAIDNKLSFIPKRCGDRLNYILCEGEEAASITHDSTSLAINVGTNLGSIATMETENIPAIDTTSNNTDPLPSDVLTMDTLKNMTMHDIYTKDYSTQTDSTFEDHTYSSARFEMISPERPGPVDDTLWALSSPYQWIIATLGFIIGIVVIVFFLVGFRVGRKRQRKTFDNTQLYTLNQIQQISASLHSLASMLPRDNKQAQAAKLLGTSARDPGTGSTCEQQVSAKIEQDPEYEYDTIRDSFVIARNQDHQEIDEEEKRQWCSVIGSRRNAGSVKGKSGNGFETIELDGVHEILDDLADEYKKGTAQAEISACKEKLQDLDPERRDVHGTSSCSPKSPIRPARPRVPPRQAISRECHPTSQGRYFQQKNSGARQDPERREYLTTNWQESDI